MTTQLTPTALIQKINAAKKLEDLTALEDLPSFKKEIHKLLHPDVCSIPGAGDALARANSMMDEFKKGKKYEDEAGEFTFNGYNLVYDRSVIAEQSIFGWNNIMKKGSDNLKKYVPKGFSLLDSKYTMELPARGVILSGLTLPQEHVNWLLSRMLEFALMVDDCGYNHLGICPESVCLDPVTHGIFVTSFYHMTPKGRKANTINGGYKSWYPMELFSTKISSASVDIQMAKKTAIYLLGDRSGDGVKLRKNVPAPFMDFVLKYHSNPFVCYQEYRAMLGKTFEKKFHILNM